MELIVEARQTVKSGRATELRRTAGLSQGELAALVGVAPSAISRWESGSRVPRPDEAVAYGRVLRKLEALIGPEGVSTTTTAATAEEVKKPGRTAGAVNR
jgi:transcriptional regulator with XRE-family HTH domain